MSAINDYVTCKKRNAANLEIIGDLIKSAKCTRTKYELKLEDFRKLICYQKQLQKEKFVQMRWKI